MTTNLNPGAQAFLDQLNQNVELAKQRGAEQVAGLGKANYSWVTNPDAFRVERDMFTAKNLPFSIAGVGLSNYGVNEDNIFSKLQQARQAKRTNTKDGGFLTIYDGIIDQTGTFSDPDQGRLMREYMETGSIPAGLTMDTVMQHMDYGLRHNARKQQRKKKGFFSGNIGAIIGAIGGATIGFAMTGNAAGAIAGAKAGGAAGGVGQAVNEHRGILGTALAGIGGYGIGSLGASIGQAAATTSANIAAQQSIKQGLLTSARAGIGSLTESLKNTLLNPIGAVKSTFQGMYNDLINPLVQTGRGVYSGIGSLANPNMTFGQGFRAGFYGPSSAGIGSLPTPDFATQQVIDASPGNIIETPTFSEFDAVSSDLGISGLDTAAPIEFTDPVTDAFKRSVTPIKSSVGVPGVDRINYELIYPISPDVATQPVMATEQVTGPVRSAGPLNTGRPPGTQLRMPKVTDGDLGAAEMIRTGQGLGDTGTRLGYFPNQTSTLPTTTQVGTFDPGAINLSGYTDQFIPTPAVAPRFTGVVGDTLANPSMPTPQPYFGQLGVPVTLAAGSVLEDALKVPEEEEDQGPIYGDFESDSEREKPVAEGFVTPLAYSGSIPQAQDPYSYGGYDEGALGRRLYSGNRINLENPFDLTPYFRSRPVFAEGGAVDTGFPMMKEIPADMRSKFMKYESGKQTIQSSAGDDEERGFMRMSGTGMEPVEESYVKKPMGLQEFFKRTPEGRFQMA